jgi:hypothetical protein
MVEQYPHSITITPVGTPEQGEGGNFEAPVNGTPATYGCRAEEAGSNPVITGPDGNSLVYRFIVYMPLIGVNYSYGDIVHIVKQDGSEYNGFLKHQSNGQLNTRLWV